MIGDSNLAQFLQNFSDQFEETDGRKYVYRQLQKGPPIQVTAEERDRFMQQYARRVRLAYWGMIPAIAVYVLLIVLWVIQDHGPLPMVALVIGVVAIGAAFVVYTMKAQTAPARELERRVPVGRARSKEEMRSRFFHKMSYGQLAGTAAGAILLVLSRGFKEDLFSGWHRLWLLLAAAAVLATGVQAFRKWRFEQENG